jgi:hypothetical protein
MVGVQAAACNDRLQPELQRAPTRHLSHLEFTKEDKLND